MTASHSLRVAVFALATAAVAAQEPKPTLLVETGRAGLLEVGAPAEDVYKIFGRGNVKLVDLNLEGYFTLAMEVRVPGVPDQPSLVVRLREFPCPGVVSVDSISVRDRRYRTARGLGIGSTIAELRRVYPIKKEVGEGSVSALVEDLQIAFSLPGFTFLESSRVTSIGLTLDPDIIRQRRCPR